MIELYEKISDLAEKQNISGKELGSMLGLKKSPLTDWKNGKSKPTLEQIKKICEIFAISADFLIFDKERYLNLTPEEQKLVDDFRNCSREIQNVIRAAAASGAATPNTVAANPEQVKDGNLSSSKIG